MATVRLKQVQREKLRARLAQLDLASAENAAFLSVVGPTACGGLLSVADCEPTIGSRTEMREFVGLDGAHEFREFVHDAWESHPVYRPWLCRDASKCPVDAWLASYRKAIGVMDLFREISETDLVRGLHLRPSQWNPTLTLPDPYRREWSVDKFARVVARTVKRWGREIFGGDIGFAANYDTLSSDDPIFSPRHLHVQLSGLSLVRLVGGGWSVHTGVVSEDQLAGIRRIYREEVEAEAGASIPRTETNPEGEVNMDWSFHLWGEWHSWEHRLTYDARGPAVIVSDYMRGRVIPAETFEDVSRRVLDILCIRQAACMTRYYGLLACGQRGKVLSSLRGSPDGGGDLGPEGEDPTPVDADSGCRCPVHKFVAVRFDPFRPPVRFCDVPENERKFVLPGPGGYTSPLMYSSSPYLESIEGTYPSGFSADRLPSEGTGPPDPPPDRPLRGSGALWGWL